MANGKSYSFESFQYANGSDGIVTCDGTTSKQLVDGESGLRAAAARQLFTDFADQPNSLSICEPFGDNALRPTVLELALSVDQAFLDRTNGSWTSALGKLVLRGHFYQYGSKTVEL